MAKNGVFLFRKSFCFVLEIFAILCYANEESDDVIGGTTKPAPHSMENNSRNIKVVQVFKLGTSIVRTPRMKQNDTYYVVAMATLLAPLSFCEKANSCNPNCNLVPI